MGRFRVVLVALFMSVPYVLLSLQYSRSKSDDVAHALVTKHEVDLTSYWSVIHEAHRLLDSLNTTLPNLVIGLAKDVPTTNLAVFAASLRKTQTTSIDIVLFVDAASYDAELKILAETHNINVQVYDLDAIEPAFLRLYHPSSFRWPLIADFLEKHQNTYDKVLFADVRDTAFQSDPFESHDRDTFYAFGGVESKTIGQCGWNGGWIKDCFGAAKLKKLFEKPILCSGVSIAGFDLGLAYVRQMSAIISHSDFAKCERNGVDQGVHNVLLHEGLVKNSQIIKQADAMVANLQAKVAVVSTPKVFRKKDRELVAVVHQYDRYPDLAQYYYATHYKESKDDLCRAFDLHKNVDLFKAKCDLSATSGTNVQDCCKACQRATNCHSFTLAGSLCYLKTCTTPATNINMQGAVSGLRRHREDNNMRATR